MNLKVNVNRIHSDLSNRYEEVHVSEGSSIELGEFVEFKILNEKKVLNLIISKREVEKNTFDWFYFSNPEKKDHIVERNSSVDKMLYDVEDIFVKNRFDSDYLSSI